MSDIQLTADFSDIQTMNRELLETAKNARSSARVFEAEYRKVERTLNQVAKANQAYFNQVLQVEGQTKSASASAEVFNKELNKQAAEVERLANKYNPLRAASKRYERELDQLNRALNQGAINNQQYASALDRLNLEFQEFNRGVARAGNQFGQYDKAVFNSLQRTKRFASVGLQQAGYQIGDFIVQVQSGQSALVAFGQQGSQLAGIFGPAGAVVGALIAAGTAIAMIVKAAKDGAKELESFENAAKSLGDEIQRLENLKVAQALGIEDVNEALVVDKINDYQQELKEIQTSINNLQTSGGGRGIFDSLELNKERKLLEDQKKQLEENIRQLRRLRFETKESADTTEILAEVSKEIAFTRAKIDAQELLSTLKSVWATMQEMSASDFTYEAPDQPGKSFPEILGERARRGPSDPGLTNQTGLPESDYEPPKPKTTRQSRSSGSSGQDPLQQLRQRIKLETQLIGKTEAQQRMIRALGIEYENYSAKQIERVQTEIEGLLKVEEQQQRIIEAQETMASSATDLFLAAADSTDAFRESLSRMLKQLGEAIIQQAILNQLQNTSGGGAVSGVIGGIAGALGFADGAAFSKGKIIPFADGGVVSSPQTFPMAGGNTGLMGEAGPEAIMPLKRGKDGKLGVSSSGGTTIVKPTINIDARGAQQGVAEQINTQITQALPTIIEATISATRERSRRGAM